MLENDSLKYNMFFICMNLLTIFFKKAFVTSYKQTISESESFIIFKII